jgi:hypothetical protein
MNFGALFQIKYAYHTTNKEEDFDSTNRYSYLLAQKADSTKYDGLILGLEVFFYNAIFKSVIKYVRKYNFKVLLSDSFYKSVILKNVAYVQKFEI